MRLDGLLSNDVRPQGFHTVLEAQTASPSFALRSLGSPCFYPYRFNGYDWMGRTSFSVTVALTYLDVVLVFPERIS